MKRWFFGVWAAWLGMLSCHGAIQRYVTPTGAGAGTGVDWANAYESIQAAIDECVSAGDTIYLAEGEYNLTAALDIDGAPGLSIRGGYAGTGTPGAFGGETVLRQYGSNIRILQISASTVAVERVTIRDGYVVNASGGGLYVTGSDVTLTDCEVRDCKAYVSTIGANVYGGGVYAVGSSVSVLGGVVSNNAIEVHTYSGHHYGGGVYVSGGRWESRGALYRNNRIYRSHEQNFWAYGGAIYANGATVLASNCVWEANRADLTDGSNVRGYGGAMCLNGGAADICDCVFTGNYVAAYRLAEAFGGAIQAANVTSLVVRASEFRGNYARIYNSGTKKGGTLYCTGAACAGRIEDCLVDMWGLTGYAEAVRVESSARLCLLDTTVMHSPGDGICFAGSMLGLTNCLVAQNAGDGIAVAAGVVEMASVTLADNPDWGVRRTGGAVTALHVIAWCNGLGGITSNENVKVQYSCVQNDVNGSDNDALTTRTDGGADGGHGDIGYHSTTGVPAGVLSNTVLFVAAVGGDDENDGLSWTAPLATMSEALSRVLRDGTIHVAAGRYDAALGETFPLTVEAPNVAIHATNRDDTVFDAGNAQRVLFANGKGWVRAAGVTFERGYKANGDGGGLYLLGCRTVLSNCTVRNCQVYKTTSGLNTHGGGIYAVDGSLELADCVVSNNRIRLQLYAASHYGGGIFASGNALVLTRCRMAGNRIYRSGDQGYHAYGGAIYNGSDSFGFTNCVFEENGLQIAPGNTMYAYGGGIYVGAGAGTIDGCLWRGNYAVADNSAEAKGGTVYIAGSSSVVVRDCDMSGGYARVTGAGTQRGGILYMAGGTASFVMCTITNNGQTYRGDIYLAGGALGLTNCLVATNGTSGVAGYGGTLYLANCTLAANAGWGYEDGGSVTRVRNTIAWGNASGGLDAGPVSVSYTCSQEEHAGSGNLAADPLFVNAAAADYHLKSRGGAWRTALARYVTDSVTSPCLDAGDPGDPYAGEPSPNGRRINMGAYGGTTYASKTRAPGTVFLLR